MDESVCHQTKSTDDFASLIPTSVRELKTLDKPLFKVNVVLPGIRCKARSCGKFLAAFKDVLFKRTNFKKIINDPQGEKQYKLMLLQSSINSIENLSDDQNKLLLDEDATFVKENCISLGYEDFTFNEVIQSIVPQDAEAVSAFETVGHIAHVNLKEHLADYKHVIGEVLLDKNVHIKTVVNKTNTINATFRFFQMELLAGEDEMFTSVNEHGCVFQFDYSKVYWNSRLQSEHKRIVDNVGENDAVFDVFAGVGPFSVPAAKKSAIVYANDLNEESYKALQHNAKLNKVTKVLQMLNMDGRDFLNQIVLKKLHESTDYRKIHIIMNLPALAPEFLDVFRGKVHDSVTSVDGSPDTLVHCYCFSKSKTPEVDAESTIRDIIGLDSLPCVSTHLVRRVAPNKVMLCVTFNIHICGNDKNVKRDGALRKRDLEEDHSEVDIKRACIDT